MSGLARRRLEPTRFGQGPAQEELDLSVDAAQVVGGPALQSAQNPGLDAQEEGLPLGRSQFVSPQPWYSVPAFTTG